MTFLILFEGAQSEAGRSRSLQRTLLRWGGGSDATARTLVSLGAMLQTDLVAEVVDLPARFRPYGFQPGLLDQL